MITALLHVSHALAQDIEAGLVWSKRVELSSPVSGVVDKVLVVSGSKVAKGDTLLQLDQRSFKTSVDKSEAEVKRTRAIRDEAKRELDRAQELYDRTLLSDHELQTAKNGHIEASARYQQAQAGLAQAKLEMEYSSIRAPFNAVVIKMLASEGLSISSELNSPVLAIIAEDGRMQARGVVSGSQLNSISLNQPARVEVNGKTYQGKVRAMSLEPANTADQYHLDVEFETGGQLLRAGQKAKISL